MDTLSRNTNDYAGNLFVVETGMAVLIFDCSYSAADARYRPIGRQINQYLTRSMRL